ncbi:hypothetical protein Salat_1862000 [Sesamum alatum]|uniref:Uncharacterized protein n=1 Tax=Sesamum alatum TaxID=300844 RepID=A0AAE2CHZ1_9LAMI|nr:hypothetical protein Salat_1862000 [Sesamum alatum]
MAPCDSDDLPMATSSSTAHLSLQQNLSSPHLGATLDFLPCSFTPLSAIRRSPDAISTGELNLVDAPLEGAHGGDASSYFPLQFSTGKDGQSGSGNHGRRRRGVAGAKHKLPFSMAISGSSQLVKK